MRRVPLLVVFSTVLVSAGAHIGAEVVTEGDLRILRVRAAADEEFRDRAAWRQVVAGYLAFASNFYEKSFEIRLDVVETVEWESDDEASLSELVDAAEDEVPLDGVDVAIGFTGQHPNRGKLSKYVSSPGASRHLWVG